MRYSKFLHALTALTVIFTSLFSFVASVAAKGSATVGTTLTLEPPVSASVGNVSHVVIHLVSSKGQPVVNQRVEFFIDGVRERRARTDASGNVSIRVRRDTVGTYKLYAAFRGSRFPSLGSSSASADLVVKPALIEIHTTPPLPGIEFLLDDQVFSSDDYGVARIEVEKAGTYQLELLPVEVKDGNIQMNFGRWGDEAFKPSREIVVPLNKSLEIGFEVSYLVSQKFVDLSHRPVDPARVSSVTLKGSNGTTYTFEDNEPHWLPAGRVIRMNNGLEETRILYSIISVVIDGSNVVSQAQQRFYVDPDDVWTVQVLLYKARFTSRDALFGFPIGSGIHMEYPDGEVQSYSLNTEEGHTIDGLARGIYRVKVTGAKGYAPSTPIALSRDQDVELLVFSYLDLGLILSIGLILSVGLLLFGRPYLVGQTVAVGRRIVSGRQRIIPAVRTQFSKLTALGSRILSRRRTAGLAHPGIDDQKQNDAASPLLAQAETAGEVHDPVIEVVSDSEREQTQQGLQENQVESAA